MNLTVEIKSFRPMQKNTLQGFATIVLLPMGLVIKDCSVHMKDGKQWLSFPARSYKKDDKTEWVNLLEWDSKEKHFSFQEIALKALANKPQETAPF